MLKWKYFLREALTFSVLYFLVTWLLFDRFDTKAVFESIFIGTLAGLSSVTIFPRILRAVNDTSRSQA